jgi:adenylate cyclase
LRQKSALLSNFVSRANRTSEAAARPEQEIRSAICASLVGGEGRALGVLYVDSLATTHRVTEDDLEFLVAFAGIAAVAFENLRLAERSRQEALIRGNFERFFTPHLAARIAATPDALRLGGERRKVAVLFSDIRGFTPLAAKLTPDATAKLLSEYFSEMAECVFTHGGTLDKFIGDAVMAQWGAPLSEADDADRALEAARAMRRALARLNARWQAQGRPQLQVGMGLNYGEVFAGYLGSERRLEYTIIGDVVNTASRLCEAAAGGEILLTAAFKAALTRTPPEALRPRPQGPLWLPGREDALPVFRDLLPASTRSRPRPAIPSRLTATGPRGRLTRTMRAAEALHIA